MQDQTESEAGQDPSEPQVYLGMFGTGASSGRPSAPVIAGFSLAALWALGFGLWALLAGADTGAPGRVGVVLLVSLLPACLTGFAVYVSGVLARLSAEAEALSQSVAALRQAMVAQKQSGVVERASPTERKLDEIAAALRKTEARLAHFTAAVQAPQPAPPADAPQKTAQVEQVSQPQASLGLEPEGAVRTSTLVNSDLIRALNFPDDPDDKPGFEALRRALQDRNSSQVINAAQDVLTLLSQDGIYMDDLTPDRARPEIWRRFAQGERGKTVAILGGIRDRSALALTAGRMRQDTIFRDSVHHFLRRFDRTFSEFEKTASDLEIVSLTDTRSARAFMLLGRVTGTFS